MLVGSVVPLALVVRSKTDSRVRRSPDCFEVRSYASLVRSFASSVVRGGSVTLVLAGAVLVTLAGLVSWVPVGRGGNEVVVTTGRVYLAVVADLHTGSLLPSDAPVLCMLKYHLALCREHPFGALE